MENARHFIGADLSKRTIDLFYRPSKSHLKITNSEEGYLLLIKWIKEHRLVFSELMIVMEHTGLYSACFEKFLHKQSIAFCKVSALEIKKSIGVVRGKTDKIDAGRIADYANEKKDKLHPQKPISKTLERLKLLRSSRELLVKQRAGLKCFVKEIQNIGTSDKDIILKAHIKTIKAMNEQIASLENEMEKTINQDEQVTRNYHLLMSIKGVGKVLAIAVIVKTDNFIRFKNARKFACFCGTAPFEFSSGSSVRKRTRVSHIADKSMKTLLELSARSAIQHNPDIKAYFQRRVAEGKSKMSTLNIIRNKIIYRMFAVIKRQEIHTETYKRAA